MTPKLSVDAANGPTKGVLFSDAHDSGDDCTLFFVKLDDMPPPWRRLLRKVKDENKFNIVLDEDDENLRELAELSLIHI